MASQIIIEQFKHAFRHYSSDTLAQLPGLYRDDVIFVDPVRRIEGLGELQRYFSGLMQNLTRCEFTYDGETVDDSSACICWNMHFQHPSLHQGAPLSLRGISRICFEEKIYRHEDFYDLGAMLYEHVPLVGGVTRYLKRRLAS